MSSPAPKNWPAPGLPSNRSSRALTRFSSRIP
ncbi:hypothetical protein [Rhodococcus qingshengii]